MGWVCVGWQRQRNEGVAAMYKAQYKAKSAYEVWTNIRTYSSESEAMKKKNSGALMVRVVDKNGIYQQAGIANASSHSGRRSGLTTLADKGVIVRVLMALAGHSQIATTQRYIDLRLSVVRAAVELV